VKRQEELGCLYFRERSGKKVRREERRGEEGVWEKEGMVKAGGQGETGVYFSPREIKRFSYQNYVMGTLCYNVT
jgi:hypothetical protein